MTAFWISTLGLIIFITLGMPIAFSIGIASVGFVLMTNPMNLVIVPLRMFSGVNSFTLLALPFFIMSARSWARRRFLQRFALANSWSEGFAAARLRQCRREHVSEAFPGRSLDIALLGKMEIDAMVENGYDRDFACALTRLLAAEPLIPRAPPPSSSGIMNMSVGPCFSAV